jgi:branched-chain amino acid aminotransferase
MDTYYVDGAFVTEDQAMLSVKDIAILRGYGVFDFLRTYNRRPFHLDEHIARLQESARQIGLTLRWSASEIRQAVMETLSRNPQHAEANIRLLVTGGISHDGVLPDGHGKLLVMVTHKHQLPDWWYRDGAKAITVDEIRPLPGAKSTNYLKAVMAQQKGMQEGAIEAIYTDRDGCLLEGTTTNLFVVRNGRLITPGEERVLRGITRMVLLDLLEGKFPIERRDIHRDELKQVDEVFITASNKEIVPIVQVDTQRIGEGKPGPATRTVMEIFRKYTVDYGKGIAD